MVVFLLVNAALLKLRHDSDSPPPFRVPLSIGRYPVPAILSILGVTVLLVLNLVALAGPPPG
jgi:hypothetical protein